MLVAASDFLFFLFFLPILAFSLYIGRTVWLCEGVKPQTQEVCFVVDLSLLVSFQNSVVCLRIVQGNCA